MLPQTCQLLCFQGEPNDVEPYMILSHLSTSISHCKTSGGCAEGGDESPATVEICKTYALAVKEIWDQMQILCVSIAGWVVGLVFSFPPAV